MLSVSGRVFVRSLARASYVLACLLFAASARAAPLRIDASAERMRVDGALREWRGARFVELGSGDDASLRYALATADGGLYLAAELRDDKLVAGEQGDALVLQLAMPDARGGYVASELTLHPGESGRSKASARLLSDGKPRSEPRLQVVEGPRASGPGYVLEAFVPWSAIRGAELWEQGRGALRFLDVDAGKRVETTLASAEAARPSELPRLALGEGQLDLLGSFLLAKGLPGVEPRFDFRADVAGDAQPERVAVVNEFVVVYGPGFKHGETYGYYALPYGTGGGLKSAELSDLTGDGRAELVTVVRQQNSLGARELWLALRIDEDSIAPLFSVELKKELKGGFVDNQLALVRQAKGQRVEVKVGRAQGLDERTYNEARATDAEPILLPWGELEARSYAFDGTRFAVVDEKRRKPSSSAAAPAAASAVPSATQAVVEPAVGEAEVLAAFKAQRKLPASAQPSHTLRANLLGGAKKERIDVFESSLVVSGPEVGDGRGYFAYGVPVSDARELLELRAVDVTGDGLDELLVRTRQTLSGADGVTRELLLVLRAENGRLARLLLAEIARRKQGEGAIENRVRTAAGTLVIEPGTAKGWSAASYPFSSDAVAGATPLLLPWRDRAVSYTLRGATLAP